MVNVLFVCLGNICRSPMAEAVFRNEVKSAGLADHFFIDSAGTGDWHVGKPPHVGTRKKLTDLGIPFEGIRGRQFTKEDLDTFDYIIAMDRDNIKSMCDMCNHQPMDQVLRFMSFLPDNPLKDVPDPYFTGNFDEVLDIIIKGSRSMLEYICKREKIKA